MITRIGLISGQIISALEQEGRPLSARELADLLLEPLEEILMTVGWLTREKYVQVESVKEECIIQLVPDGDLAAFHNRLLAFNDAVAHAPVKAEHIEDKQEKPDKSHKSGKKSDKEKDAGFSINNTPRAGFEPEIPVQRFAGFVGAMECGVYMADAKGILSYVNDAFIAMLGYHKKEELLGKNLFQEFHMNSNDHAQLLAQLKENGYVHDYELKYVCKGGRVVILSETVHGVKDTQGSVVALEGVVRDITEKKKNDEQLWMEKMKLEHILSLHEEISSILKLEELIDFVIAKAIEILDVHRCSLMLIDKDRSELVIKGAKGLSEDIIQDTRVKLGEQISGVVALYGEPMLVTDMDAQSPLPRKSRATYRGRSFLSVPIKLEKKVIGVLNVADKGLNKNDIFTPTDLRILSAIVRQAAVAIENANLYRELKYLSITDPLTGLYNHRHFAKTIDQEIKRLRRYPGPLCLMMIDVDHFKTYNDTFGHLEGDHLLKELARAIHKNLREIDVACRYGGDEFAVILVETKIHKAEIVAKKIQKAISELSFKRPVTLSVGVAAYSDSVDRHDLILKADRALYQSKKEGRNRVSVYA